MTIPLDASELVGALGETVFFGLYLLMFPASLITMHYHHRRSRTRTGSIVFLRTVAIFLFACVTTHWLLSMSRAYSAFIEFQHITRGSLLFYSQLGEPRDVAQVVLYSLELIILDLLLIFRLHVIWNRAWWVIVLPGLTLIGSIVACVFLSIEFACAPPNFVFPGSVASQWETSAYALSLATNALSVSFIAYRIIRRDRGLRYSGAKSLMPILMTIIEGAGMTCVLSIVIMVTLLAGENIYSGLVSISSPVTGISFCLITLRVGLRGALSDFVGQYTAGNLSAHSAAAYPMEIRVDRVQDQLRVEANRNLEAFPQKASSSLEVDGSD